jgi:hypothetical protein
MELVAGCAGASERPLDTEFLQLVTDDIPMPRRHPDTRAGILERLVLEPLRAKSEHRAHGQETFAVRADEMHHGLAPEPPPVKPNAAVEGEAKPIAAAHELLPGLAQLQVILPSCVAVPTGAALP